MTPDVIDEWFRLGVRIAGGISCMIMLIIAFITPYREARQ